MSSVVYRAIVTQADPTTGDISVRIPALSGYDSTIAVSKIARTAYNGTWVVPAIGSQIVVTADDSNLTNLFWVQVSPSESLSTIKSDIDSAEASIAGLSSSVLDLTTRVTTLESYKDAAMLGIFN